MDHPLYDLISAKIKQAEADGAFDNLPGAGKPLPKVEDPENELINRLMRENNATPEFVTLGRELKRLRQELEHTTDATRKRDIMRDMSMMDARIDLAKKAFRR